MARVFIMQITSSFYGGWRGFTLQITSLVWTRKFLTGDILSFWEGLKQQVAQLLNLVLVTRAIK